MKAVVLRKFGSPDALSLEDLPAPEPKAGEVLLQVRATSINPVDVKIRSGALPDISPELPGVLHGDVAGVVAAVGAGVTGFREGDEVYGCVGGTKGSPGTLQELVAVDPVLLAPKPTSLSFAEAAALPLVGITAWEALFERVTLRPGQNVLVHAGAGGVGHLAVQFARLAGCTVAATASPAKAAFAQSLGADAVIDYKSESVTAYTDRLTGGRGFDVVLDTVGGTTLAESFEAAKISGHVVSILTLSQQDLTAMHVKGLSLHVVFMLLPLLTGRGRAVHGQWLRELAALVDLGRARPHVDRTFPLQEAAAAHACFEEGRHCGKVVIEVAA